MNLSLFFEIPATGALEENRAEYCVRTGVNTAWGYKISICKHYMNDMGYANRAEYCNIISGIYCKYSRNG